MPETKTAETAEDRLAALIIRVGDPGKCGRCNAGIFWIRHRNGKIGIYDPDGTSHFATCPNAEKHRKRITEV